MIFREGFVQIHGGASGFQQASSRLLLILTAQGRREKKYTIYVTTHLVTTQVVASLSSCRPSSFSHAQLARSSRFNMNI